MKKGNNKKVKKTKSKSSSRISRKLSKNKGKKKAQNLPMTTIVLMIISLIVLTTVAIFFFGQFSSSKKSVDAQTEVSRTITSSAKCDAWASGFIKLTSSECAGCDLDVIKKAIANGAKFYTNADPPLVEVITSEAQCVAE